MRQISTLTLIFLGTLLVSCDTQTDVRSQVSASGTIRAQGSEIPNGQPAVDFRLQSLNGEFAGREVSLADFRGKVVLLNFWATWCPPCVSEMPALERLHVALKDKGFVVVSINLDPTAMHQQVLEFSKKHGLTFSILADSEIELPPQYGITGFPESFFLDRQGRHMEFLDPHTKLKLTRVVSDREWDSPVYLSAIEKLLSSQLEFNK